MPKFVHLHVHTQYSILDGASPIKKLIAKAKSLGMESIAITDHGNMFGVKNFHEVALKEGIKPILGCECYVARENRHTKIQKSDRGGHHLILLVKNQIGYNNLMKLVSYSYTEGFYSRPRIDKELLEKYHEGLICCSACLGGEIPQHILADNIQKAEDSARWFKNLFGEDYYIELQLLKSKIPGVGADVYRDQMTVNGVLLDIGKRLDIKCIVTNDIHFVDEQDAEAHDHLICLNTGKSLTDEGRRRYTGQEYLKSAEEMSHLFPQNTELMENTLEIASKIEDINLNHKPFMPNFPLPDDFEISIPKLISSYKKSLVSVINQAKETKRELLQQQWSTLSARIDDVKSVQDLEQLAQQSLSEFDPEFETTDKLDIAKQFLYLEYITFEGAKKRYPQMDDETRERIEFELATIERMGYPGYFLIVWDFIRAGREMGVSVGPGRGSAAGSVVAYCLWITNIDPIKYNLLFERFLNPERISMPDIDIDFDDDGRESVMQYVVQKYGADRVAHIITFGKMGAKNSIKDVARVQELPIPESNRLAKLVPEKPGISLQKAFAEVAELDAERKSENPVIRKTLELATTLEGSVRQTGVNACGIIIGKDDLINYVPIYYDKSIPLNIVQYDGHYVESVGLLKMDFLGLKTLSIIKDCVKIVKYSKGVDVDIDSVSLEDQKTFELYSRGDTTGIFQFESPGMKKHLRSLGPNRFEDLIAMNALYRPGPMEYIPDFIARKKGEKSIEYDMPNMDKYLEETYGITVYQEQVMLLSQLLAGFTKGQADNLRKAMGKKMKDVLDKMKDSFVDGAVANGYDREKCIEVWGKWEAFASYAFNKSHSTCYAYVSYQTAYLKAHYPSEFMAALLSRNFSDIKKISFFMDECKKMGRVVKGPDVNESILEFSVNKNEDIRFGLSAIKGIGTAASESIIRERESGGKFIDIFDFIERIDSRVVGKKVIENLVDAGAFDSLSGFNRALFKYQSTDNVDTFLDEWFTYGVQFREEKNQSENSLFGDFSDMKDMIERPKLPSEDGKEWSNIAILNRERELIGMYVSFNPLDDYRYLVDKYAPHSIKMLDDTENNKDKSFAVAGIIEKVEIFPTKAGSEYCKLTLTGDDGSHEFALFGKNYEKHRAYYHPNTFVIVSGKIDKRYQNDSYRPIISDISTMQEQNDKVKGIEITIENSHIDPQFAENLTLTLEQYPGNKSVYIRVFDRQKRLVINMATTKFKVETNRLLLNSIENLGLTYKII